MVYQQSLYVPYFHFHAVVVHLPFDLHFYSVVYLDFVLVLSSAQQDVIFVLHENWILAQVTESVG